MDDYIYTTDDELEYISNIGDEARAVENMGLLGRPRRLPIPPKVDLLRGYIKRVESRQRNDWGEIDGAICLAHAKDLLKTLTGRSEPAAHVPTMPPLAVSPFSPRKKHVSRYAV